MKTAAQDPIYLDFNASTPVIPAVLDAMLPFLRDHHGNPSSSHVYGRRAAQAVENARQQVAGLLDCQPEEVLFTSGGTESNNLAIRGVAASHQRAGQIITSAVEHPAVEKPCAYLEKQGWQVTRLPVDAQGRVDPSQAEARATQGALLATVMHANNETGSLQPISQLSEKLHARGVLVHTDAAQSVGKVPTSVKTLGVDLLSVAGHKLYAPKGVGALFVKQGTPLTPLLLGAGHERGLRPGTENVPYIVGLGRACAIAQRTLAEETARVGALRNRLWALLEAEIPDLALNGHPERRLPNTLNVRFPGVRGSAVLAHAPELAASTGSACHEGGERPSSVLLALGLGEEEALGSVRISLGRTTTTQHIEVAATAMVRAFRQLV